MSSEPLFLVSFIYEIEGTSLGSRVALWLALLAAFLHAVFGALQKGRHDPWLSRGAIDASSGLAMVPLAIFVVPIPEPRLWPIFLVIFLIHFIYKLLQAFAYSKGSFTVVYPVVRGTSPIFTVFGALEMAFWRTLGYSVIWWWLVVYRCERGDSTATAFDLTTNHCHEYNGSDVARVVIVSSHVIWTIACEAGVARGHPFVWAIGYLQETVGKQAVRRLRLGPEPLCAEEKVEKKD